jgi:alpha-tubulin suppressor-like RCC1 family protein
MEGLANHKVLWMVAAVVVGLAGAGHGGQVRAWGANSHAQVSGVPAGGDFTAVAAGDAHGLALRADGTIAAWGRNNYGQCNVPPGTYKAVAAGGDFSLAIRTTGSLAVWGRDTNSRIAKAPAGSDFVAVDGGEAFAVALRRDGSLVAWGDDRWQQVSGAPKDKGFQAVAAGDTHAVALRSDGSVVSWGYWAALAGAPKSRQFTAIDAGGNFCVALQSDGSLVWWGDDSAGYGVYRVPPGAGHRAVAAGYLHGVALKKDGSLVGWGAGQEIAAPPHWGQARPPTNGNYTAVACGLHFSLALTSETGTATLADNFNDNQPGNLWRFMADDPANCWLQEVNERLELRATGQARMTAAYYIGNGWQIDPRKDFAFRIDFHCSLRTERTGRVFVGLTPDVGDLKKRHVEFGVGCGKLQPYLWLEAPDGRVPLVEIADRRQEDGVLYVWYEARADTLYVSTVGYGARNVWRAVPGLLGTSWSSQPLWLYLGGDSDGQEIEFGAAYLDDFVVEQGSPWKPSLRSVYRFSAPALQWSFYTIDPRERDKLIRDYAEVWTYDGVVYRAAETPSVSDLAPVYRFWSPASGHFYTIDPTEKDRLIRHYPHVWTFEGVAFYAYPDGRQAPSSKPVYHFRRPRDNSYFYTIDTREADWYKALPARLYVFEGIAYYAWE